MPSRVIGVTTSAGVSASVGIGSLGIRYGVLDRLELGVSGTLTITSPSAGAVGVSLVGLLVDSAHVDFGIRGTSTFAVGANSISVGLPLRFWISDILAVRLMDSLFSYASGAWSVSVPIVLQVQALPVLAMNLTAVTPSLGSAGSDGVLAFGGGLQWTPLPDLDVGVGVTSSNSRLATGLGLSAGLSLRL